ncbi:MAG: hypothetical protein LBE83_09955 [Propionibacteriaceae bacterium]|jgi:hypothetical protein|nr:hypothetical protein [Propionibacteriaceae bacterium]
MSEPDRWGWAFPGPPTLPADLADDLAEGWSSRTEAEDWLRLVFDDLAESGVEQVELMWGTTSMYTMGLEPI